MNYTLSLPVCVSHSPNPPLSHTHSHANTDDADKAIMHVILINNIPSGAESFVTVPASFQIFLMLSC